LTHNYFI